MTVIDFVNDNDGCLATSANTSANFQGDHTVTGSLTRSDPQHLLGFVKHLGDTANITSGTNTELDDMFTAGNRGKERVKGNHAMHFTDRDAEAFCNILLHWNRKVTNFGL